MVRAGRSRTVRNSVRFHYAIHSMRFQMYELLVSGIFHWISSDFSGPLVTEAKESEAMDKGVYCIQLNSNNILHNSNNFILRETV